MPDEVQYGGYVIEAQSYESDGARWRPHAVVIIHVGRGTREHHVSAPDVRERDLQQELGRSRRRSL